MDADPTTKHDAGPAHPAAAPPPRPPDVQWIHSLAGEWQSRWERLQYPQVRSGASLLK